MARSRWSQYPELMDLRGLTDVETDLLVSERRPLPMAWAVMLAR